MGCYVNPPMMGKEDWLLKYGRLVGSIKYDGYCPQAHIDWKGNKIPSWESYSPNLPVVLVDNRAFTAAGVAYCKDEYEEFIRERDSRPRLIFSVPVDLLFDVSDLKDYRP
jgi:hypothetical protein